MITRIRLGRNQALGFRGGVGIGLGALDVLIVALLGDGPDVLGDAGMSREDAVEGGSRELIEVAVVDGAHARRAGLAEDEGHLAEEVARGQRGVHALAVGGDDFDCAVADEVHLLARVAVAQNVVAGDEDDGAHFEGDGADEVFGGALEEGTF